MILKIFHVIPERYLYQTSERTNRREHRLTSAIPVLQARDGIGLNGGRDNVNRDMLKIELRTGYGGRC